MEKRLIVTYQAGVSNRICNIINGIYLSEKLNRKLYVHWPINIHCQCPLDEIFENKFNLYDGKCEKDNFVLFIFLQPGTNVKSFILQNRNIVNRHKEIINRQLEIDKQFQRMYSEKMAVREIDYPDNKFLEELRNVKANDLFIDIPLVIEKIISEDEIGNI